MRVEIGKALSAAREVFGKDDKAFGKWRQGRLPWLEIRSALRFIQVYEKFLPRQIVEVDLMPSVLYALAAPSTPESAVVEIISRVQGGSLLSRTCPGTGRMPYFIQLSHAWKHAKRL